MTGNRVICFILVFGFSITYANIIPNEEIGKNTIEIKRLKTEMQSVVQTIVRFSFILNTKIKYSHTDRNFVDKFLQAVIYLALVANI